MKFMIVTTLMLFWVFYETSGGAGFEPEKPVIAEVVAEEVPAVTVASVVPSELVVPLVEDSSILLASAEVEAPFDDATAVMVVEEVVSETEIVYESLAQDAYVDTRYVDGDRVNMRSGPSTDYQVLDILGRGTQAEIVDYDGNGWVQVRLDTGQTGWMAERLLSDG